MVRSPFEATLAMAGVRIAVGQMTVLRRRVGHLTEDGEQVAQAVLEWRLDGLWTICIPAPPRKITDEQVEAVISTAPE